MISKTDINEHLAFLFYLRFLISIGLVFGPFGP
jgi:hypothetical protein